jgi:hypothetical protein
MGYDLAVLEIEDVNAIRLVKPKSRNSEESWSLSTRGFEDDDKKRVFPAGCPIHDGCDAGW